MPAQGVGVDGFEGASPYVQDDFFPVYTPLLQYRHHLRSEVEAGGGRGDGTFGFCKHGLLAVLVGGFGVAAEIGR